MYADDFKVYREIGDTEDCRKLQSDLDSISCWFQSNNMYLNADKCSVITYTRKVNVFKFDYSLNKASLTRHNKCKDLGVEFQSNLRFSDHYNSIINKAYRALGFVIRNSKHFKKIDSVVRLFNCLVRPHLEYAAVIWSPQTEVNINHIEKVQKRFLRYLYVRKYNEYPFLVSYKSMLTSFKIQSLYDRRCMQSVLLIYNIVNSLKYKSSFLINYVNFYVPKINLRLQNNNIFLLLCFLSFSFGCSFRQSYYYSVCKKYQ